MNHEEFEKEIINEFDYSNIVPECEPISFLIQYCDTIYKQLQDMINQEEVKNEKLKSEFKYYEYKKGYDTKFDVTIKKKSNDYSNLGNIIVCDNFNKFMEAVNDGYLKNINSLIIELNLSYKRGKEFELKNYNNSFKISINPYDIKFIRKSNHSEEVMNKIETDINEIFKKFKTENTIFSSK